MDGLVPTVLESIAFWLTRNVLHQLGGEPEYAEPLDEYHAHLAGAAKAAAVGHA